MPTKPNVYTLDQVAEILQMTRRTMYSYVKSGKLKAIKIGGKWRVTEAALNEFLGHGTNADDDQP